MINDFPSESAANLFNNFTVFTFYQLQSQTIPIHLGKSELVYLKTTMMPRPCIRYGGDGEDGLAADTCRSIGNYQQLGKSFSRASFAV